VVLRFGFCKPQTASLTVKNSQSYDVGSLVCRSLEWRTDSL